MATMPYRCLAEFLEDLGHAGELTRAENAVDPALELPQIAARSAKLGGNALLFGSVKGHDLPVLCNLLATEGRIFRALGVASLDDLADRIARLLDTTAPEGWFERFKAGAQPAALDSIAPRKVKSAAVHQIVRLGSDINLGELPLLQGSGEANISGGGIISGGADIPVCHSVPDSRDRQECLPHHQECLPHHVEKCVTAITSVPVFSAEPDSHRPVAGRFDLQQIDRTRLAVCWAPHDEHARLLGEYRTRNQKMPLAVVIGGDPAFLLANIAPLPPGSDVCAVAGFLREKSLDVVACRSVDLDVPAEAEFIIEGFVDPTQPLCTAGSLCGPTGHCTLPRSVPVMQVTAVTHRANPIYAVMVPGRPPHEACTAARAMQRAFRPLARLAMPELIDYDLPEFAAARLWAAVSIRKTYAGQARRAAHAAWNLPAMMFAKMLVVVDADVDVHDHQQVLAAVAANMRPDRDVILEQGPADPFDPAASAGALGQKMALDATRKLDSE